MLSLSSLLNPAPPGPPDVSRFLPNPAVSPPAGSYTDDSPPLNQTLMAKSKMLRESVSISRSKPRGAIIYSPFQQLDEFGMDEIRKFRVSPFGRIQEQCSHIPYNSGKKDFFEKTGRESFEVFRYEFQPPGDDTEYTVMWDYNVGLVRMTPFFKCCQYGKTMPAKMLSLNPGLKDVTHSITGGAISAQGYWMPYNCAKAVCATFCFNIAGALIPIFGPAFPSQCVRPDTSDYGRMIISPRLIAEAAREAELWRRTYLRSFTSAGFHGNPATATSPKRDRKDTAAARGSGFPLGGRRLRTKNSLGSSPYMTDTDGDGGGRSGTESASIGTVSLASANGYMSHYTSLTHARAAAGVWAAADGRHHLGSSAGRRRGYAYPTPEEPRHAADPWLSAVPRFAPPDHADHVLVRPWTSANKRPMEYDDIDYGYEGGESHSGSSPATSTITAPHRAEDPPADGTEKKAALLLINLSVRDRGGAASATPVTEEADGAVVHRSKRRRATSM